MLSAIKNTVHKILPDKLDKWLTDIHFKFQFKISQKYHRDALSAVRKKSKIKVAFFIFKESVWKFEELYRLMETHNKFEPLIVVCPYMDYGEESMMFELNKTYNYFKEKRYNVVKTWDNISAKWLDVKKDVQPDIIFFSAPWYFTKPQYLIENYPNTLTCYVPYTFVISILYEGYFNQHMQNFVWKSFQETSIHKEISKKYARNKGVNTIVTGYPGMDKLLRTNYHAVDVWKNKNKGLKKIIWSPHHTIQGKGDNLDYSTFLKYADIMLEIAGKYKNEIQFSFKPHPSLKSKLELDEIWGKGKTKDYFDTWKNLPNGQLNEGEYIDLFATSDGMLNDSSSFIIEYLYTGKPQLYLVSDENVAERFNEVGKAAISIHYPGNARPDIEKFIDEVIIQGNDILHEKRVDFFNSIIKPPNNLTATENIFNVLKSEIFGN